jgi:diacylglycerol kinase family enzyme
LVSIANTRQLGNGAIIAPHAAPDDGLLDVCIVDDINILQALFNLPSLFTGLIDNNPYTEFYRASNIEIVRPKAAPIHVDGETLDGDKSLNVSLLPNALNVMVPDNSQNIK